MENLRLELAEYRVIEKLGSGSYGSAHLAHHSPTGTRRVIKRIPTAHLPPNEVIVARQEVQVLSRLVHPYITQFRGSCENDGFLMIAMDYCGGGDLHSLITSRGTILFPEERVMDWFVQLCLAIKYIHDRKILHRDIKAQNIFLTEDGKVKLGDFGIAKILNSSSDLARTCIGTPYYLSPEMCENKPYNNRSDIWALGCVLYEMLTLRHAFEANNMKSLIVKIVKGIYPPVPPRYSRDLRLLLAQVFQRQPQARPSISEILRKSFILKRVSRFISGCEEEELMASLIRRKCPIPASARRLSVPKRPQDVTDPSTKYAASVSVHKKIGYKTPVRSAVRNIKHTSGSAKKTANAKVIQNKGLVGNKLSQDHRSKYQSENSLLANERESDKSHNERFGRRSKSVPYAYLKADHHYGKKHPSPKKLQLMLDSSGLPARRNSDSPKCVGYAKCRDTETNSPNAFQKPDAKSHFSPYSRDSVMDQEEEFMSPPGAAGWLVDEFLTRKLQAAYQKRKFLEALVVSGSPEPPSASPLAPAHYPSHTNSTEIITPHETENKDAANKKKELSNRRSKPGAQRKRIQTPSNLPTDNIVEKTSQDSNSEKRGAIPKQTKDKVNQTLRLQSYSSSDENEDSSCVADERAEEVRAMMQEKMRRLAQRRSHKMSKMVSERRQWAYQREKMFGSTQSTGSPSGSCDNLNTPGHSPKHNPQISDESLVPNMSPMLDTIQCQLNDKPQSYRLDGTVKVLLDSDSCKMEVTECNDSPQDRGKDAGTQPDEAKSKVVKPFPISGTSSQPASYNGDDEKTDESTVECKPRLFDRVRTIEQDKINMEIVENSHSNSDQPKAHQDENQVNVECPFVNGNYLNLISTINDPLKANGSVEVQHLQEINGNTVALPPEINPELAPQPKNDIVLIEMDTGEIEVPGRRRNSDGINNNETEAIVTERKGELETYLGCASITDAESSTITHNEKQITCSEKGTVSNQPTTLALSPGSQGTEKLIQGTEKNPKSLEKLPQSTEKIPENTEILPKSPEKIPKSTEKIPHNTENLPESTEKLTPSKRARWGNVDTAGLENSPLETTGSEMDSTSSSDMVTVFREAGERRLWRRDCTELISVLSEAQIASKRDSEGGKNVDDSRGRKMEDRSRERKENKDERKAVDKTSRERKEHKREENRGCKERKEIKMAAVPRGGERSVSDKHSTETRARRAVSKERILAAKSEKRLNDVRTSLVNKFKESETPEASNVTEKNESIDIDKLAVLNSTFTLKEGLVECVANPCGGCRSSHNEVETPDASSTGQVMNSTFEVSKESVDKDLSALGDPLLNSTFDVEKKEGEGRKNELNGYCSKEGVGNVTKTQPPLDSTFTTESQANHQHINNDEPIAVSTEQITKEVPTAISTEQIKREVLTAISTEQIKEVPTAVSTEQEPQATEKGSGENNLLNTTVILETSKLVASPNNEAKNKPEETKDPSQKPEANSVENNIRTRVCDEDVDVGNEKQLSETFTCDDNLSISSSVGSTDGLKKAKSGLLEKLRLHLSPQHKQKLKLPGSSKGYKVPPSPLAKEEKGKKLEEVKGGPEITKESQASSNQKSKIKSGLKSEEGIQSKEKNGESENTKESPASSSQKSKIKLGLSGILRRFSYRNEGDAKISIDKKTCSDDKTSSDLKTSDSEKPLEKNKNDKIRSGENTVTEKTAVLNTTYTEIQNANNKEKETDVECLAGVKESSAKNLASLIEPLLPKSESLEVGESSSNQKVYLSKDNERVEVDPQFTASPCKFMIEGNAESIPKIADDVSSDSGIDTQKTSISASYDSSNNNTQTSSRPTSRELDFNSQGTENQLDAMSTDLHLQGTESQLDTMSTDPHSQGIESRMDMMSTDPHSQRTDSRLDMLSTDLHSQGTISRSSTITSGSKTGTGYESTLPLFSSTLDGTCTLRGIQIDISGTLSPHDLSPCDLNCSDVGNLLETAGRLHDISPVSTSAIHLSLGNSEEFKNQLMAYQDEGHRMHSSTNESREDVYVTKQSREEFNETRDDKEELNLTRDVNEEFNVTRDNKASDVTRDVNESDVTSDIKEELNVTKDNKNSDVTRDINAQLNVTRDIKEESNMLKDTKEESNKINDNIDESNNAKENKEGSSEINDKKELNEANENKEALNNIIETREGSTEANGNIPETSIAIEGKEKLNAALNGSPKATPDNENGEIDMPGRPKQNIDDSKNTGRSKQNIEEDSKNTATKGNVQGKSTVMNQTTEIYQEGREREEISSVNQEDKDRIKMNAEVTEQDSSMQLDERQVEVSKDRETKDARDRNTEIVKEPPKEPENREAGSNNTEDTKVHVDHKSGCEDSKKTSGATGGMPSGYQYKMDDNGNPEIVGSPASVHRLPHSPARQRPTVLNICRSNTARPAFLSTAHLGLDSSIEGPRRQKLLKGRCNTFQQARMGSRDLAEVYFTPVVRSSKRSEYNANARQDIGEKPREKANRNAENVNNHNKNFEKSNNDNINNEMGKNDNRDKEKCNDHNENTAGVQEALDATYTAQEVPMESDDETEDLAKLRESMERLLNKEDKQTKDGDEVKRREERESCSSNPSDLWHLDGGGGVVAGGGGGGSGGVYGWIEEQRAKLEDVLGLELFLKAYQELECAQEREGCVVGGAVRAVEKLLGPPHSHLTPHILQLVVADAVYHN